LNNTWLIFIQNGDLALSIVTWKSIVIALLCLSWIVELNPEFEVGIPLLVIDNWDLNLFLLFSLLKLDFLVDCLVVLG